MSPAPNPRQPTGRRIGRALPVPVTRDLTDDELTARIYDWDELAGAADTARDDEVRAVVPLTPRPAPATDGQTAAMRHYSTTRRPVKRKESQA